MKTLSGIFAFVVLAVIAIVTLPSCCRKQVSEEVTDKTVFLQFGTKTKTKTEYVEVNKTDFDKALCTLKANGGQYKVEFLADPKATPIDDYDPDCSQVSINTDKITTARVVQAEPAEESSAYDPNVVYHVRSNSPTDVKNVLDTFKKPSPTPTP